MTGRGFAGMLVTCACVALAGCGGEPRARAPTAPVKHSSKGPANVLLVVDSSEGMGGDRLDRARAALDALVLAVPSSERVGLARFAARFEPLVPVMGMGSNRAALRKALAGVRAAGPSAAYESILLAYGVQRELAAGRRLNAVIVLAHAEDSASRSSYARVRRLLARGGPRLRVFTIAYDTPPDSGLRRALADLASVTGGRALTATPANVGAVLRQVWSSL